MKGGGGAQRTAAPFGWPWLWSLSRSRPVVYATPPISRRRMVTERVGGRSGLKDNECLRFGAVASAEGGSDDGGVYRFWIMALRAVSRVDARFGIVFRKNWAAGCRTSSIWRRNLGAGRLWGSRAVASVARGDCLEWLKFEGIGDGVAMFLAKSLLYLNIQDVDFRC